MARATRTALGSITRNGILLLVLFAVCMSAMSFHTAWNSKAQASSKTYTLQAESTDDKPKLECPKQECPKQDCPKQDCPKQDCPKQDCPKQDCPEGKPIILEKVSTAGGKMSAPPFLMSRCFTDQENSDIQKSKLNAKCNGCLAAATCDEVGMCTCPDSMYFNGLGCIDKEEWQNGIFKKLSEKWRKVPGWGEEYTGEGVQVNQAKHDFLEEDDGYIDRDANGRIMRMSSAVLAKSTDKVLEEYWDSIAAMDTFTMFYASVFTGKKLIDFGSGLARQSIRFAMLGADITFIDVAPTNLQVIQRVCKLKGCEDRCHTILLKSANFQELREGLKGQQFDGLLAFGSMHHVPRELVRQQQQIIMEHLKIGAKWVQLAYPINRWTESGQPPFSDGGWGGDGPDTPWAEWYDMGKLLKSLQPGKFLPQWCGIINRSEFIWMEIVFNGGIAPKLE